MKKNTMKILTGILILLSSIFLNAQDLTSVEWAPFIKVKGISDKQLINAANKVNERFLSKQKGYIKRELIKKTETEYADIVYWKTKEDGLAAGEKVFNSDDCNEYFKLMDMEKSKSAGSGFSHYKILKKWN